jgi:synaptosomal-associated protein 25
MISNWYYQGEKLLNNLGGIFSKPWKPKKTRDITGPLITAGF